METVGSVLAGCGVQETVDGPEKELRALDSTYAPIAATRCAGWAARASVYA
jgi:hypothetical protein